MAEKKTEKAKEEACRYTKGQLLSSARYKNSRDAISVVLMDNGTYTLEEVDKKLKNFMERKAETAYGK